MIGKVYGPDMSRERLAALARVVFDCLHVDKVAVGTFLDAARELAELVASVAARLRLQPQGYTLGLAGGVLLQQRSYLDQVLAALVIRLGPSGPLPREWKVVAEPVQGAVALAQKLIA